MAFPPVSKLYKQSCLSFVHGIKRRVFSVPSAEADQMKSTGKDLLQKLKTQAFQRPVQPARKGESAEYISYNLVLLRLNVIFPIHGELKGLQSPFQTLLWSRSHELNANS